MVSGAIRVTTKRPGRVPERRQLASLHMMLSPNSTPVECCFEVKVISDIFADTTAASADMASAYIALVAAWKHYLQIICDVNITIL